MIRTLRLTLYTIGGIAALLGLWGVLSNAIPLILPDSWAPKWNFFLPSEYWDASKPYKAAWFELDAFWWVLSMQVPCGYIHPWLFGPVGYGFYALCFCWGMGTILMLRRDPPSSAGRGSWLRLLFGVWWLIGLIGIVAHVMFFVSIARAAVRAGLWP